MVGRLTLDQVVGVRVPAPQPSLFSTTELTHLVRRRGRGGRSRRGSGSAELARRAVLAVRHGLSRLVVREVEAPPLGGVEPRAAALDADERVVVREGSVL